MNTDITQSTTGLILAGGAGSRVQGHDKGLLEFRGKRLIDHVAGRLAPQVGHLIISCNRNVESYSGFADQLVSDQREQFQGPLAGIEAAVPMVDGGLLIVVPCDAPALPRDLVERLAAPLLAAKTALPDVSYAHDGERQQFLFAGVRQPALLRLKEYLDAGGRSVKGWYEELNCEVVDFSDQPGAFANCNTMGELESGN